MDAVMKSRLNALPKLRPIEIIRRHRAASFCGGIAQPAVSKAVQDGAWRDDQPVRPDG
jgi:hypothetical protein